MCVFTVIHLAFEPNKTCKAPQVWDNKSINEIDDNTGKQGKKSS